MPIESILLFIPTIASVSLTPGLCMTLAFTLGISIGYRRALFMMAGELLGVATVFSLTFWGLGWLLSRDPIYFSLLSLIGGCYLFYLAVNLYREPMKAITTQNDVNTSPWLLASLGYVTAVMNPKGWAFLMALLPGFVVTDVLLFPQWLIMLSIMLSTEFLSLSLYASGGQWLAQRVSGEDARINPNKIAATMLGLAAMWVLSGVVG